MQKFLTLVMVAVILYVVTQSKSEMHSVSNQDQETIQKIEKKSDDLMPEIEGGFVEKSLSNVLINVLKSKEGRDFLEKVVRPIDKPLNGEYSLEINNYNIVNELFKIQTILPGSGPKASCGHIATINYEIINSNKGIVESGTKTFTLGDAKMIRGLSNIIVGMQKGETRKAMIPEQYAYADPHFNGVQPSHPTSYYYVTVSLIDIMPNNFVDESVKIFDDEIAYVIPHLCGDKTTFNAKITKTSGETLFDSFSSEHPITMHLGDNTYPMIFSHALFNKTSFGTRTVICKGQHLRSLFSQEKSKIFTKPSDQPNLNEYFLLEIKDIVHSDSMK